MTTTVVAIIDDILRRELPAGVTWAESKARLHPADRGGLTRGGITSASWGTYAQLGRPATRAELNAITEPQARQFYRQRHVAPFDTYPDPLRVLLVDFGVMSSHRAVFRALQKALRDQGLYRGQIDGRIGPQSRAAIKAPQLDHRQLYNDTLNYRQQYYITLAFDRQARAFLKSHPTSQLAFLRGWLARCWEFVRP